MSVCLVWATPDTDKLIAYMARASNPKGQDKHETAPKLIAYMIRNKHWSPFDLCSVCMEIVTTRDIGRQILRHSSLKPQEFSQRYADVTQLDGPVIREARMQHQKNRQDSIACDDASLQTEWARRQQEGWDRAVADYTWALKNGIAKECARVVLPEGNTPTRMYFSGTIRSWLHYCALRRGNGTQKEHQAIADAAWDVLRQVAPACTAAWEASQ